MKTKNLVAVGLTLLLAATYGFGQMQKILKAKVPFQFTVDGKKSFPAGEYEFRYDTATDIFRVMGPDGPGQEAFTAKTMTWLAGDVHTDPTHPPAAHVVFDNVGDIHMLSEIWFPGDVGYAIQLTKDKHNHTVVNATYAPSGMPLSEEPQ